MLWLHLFLFFFQVSYIYICPMKKDISTCIGTLRNNVKTDLFASYVTQPQIYFKWSQLVAHYFLVSLSLHPAFRRVI